MCQPSRGNASGLLQGRTIPSVAIYCSSSQVRGERRKHRGALRKAPRVMRLRLPSGGVTGVEGGRSGLCRTVRAAGVAADYERVSLLSSTRIRTVPQFPHLNSAVGLGSSSTGGAVGTMSGAGTTLSVLCGRAGIAATSSKFGQLPILVQRSSHALRELIYVNYACSAARSRSCAVRPKLPWPHLGSVCSLHFLDETNSCPWMKSRNNAARGRLV
jgi:hypothetical protein